jgi:uncharacterized protein
MNSTRRSFRCLGFVALTGTACSAGTVADAVRPDVPTAANALEEGECRNVEQGGQPLIVDWKPNERGDLEVAMKDGVAIVAYSCSGIKLLADCRLDGDYGFIGMTRREQVVRLAGADELRANLPLSGVQLSSELQRGMSLDIAMMMVGKKRTTWTTPTKGDLKGTCDGATHFVRGAIVGAFAMSTGSQAKVRAAAEIFGAGTEGASESSKQTQNRDGDVGDCQKAAPDSEQPPAQCGAPIRLVLAPLAAAPATTPPPDVAAEIGCPAGMVFADGKCTTKAATEAYECKPNELEDCRAQCDKGNAASCGIIGEHQAQRGDAGAAELLKKGCDGGHARSCATLGKQLVSGANADPATAVRLFEKSCQAGDAGGCRELGRAYLAGTAPLTKDENRAGVLLRQACDGADIQSCSTLAEMAEDGKGGPVDGVRAGQLYKRACDGGLAEACAGAGRVFSSGRVKNEILAQIAYQRGCIMQHAASCAGLGRLQYGKNPDQARQSFTQACNLRDQLGCAALKLLYGDARPVHPPVELTNRLGATCRSGNASDCTSLGLLDAARGQTAPAKFNLQTACTRGDAFACALLKKLP